jgi:hypothetical protein
MQDDCFRSTDRYLMHLLVRQQYQEEELSSKDKQVWRPIDSGDSVEFSCVPLNFHSWPLRIRRMNACFPSLSTPHNCKSKRVAISYKSSFRLRSKSHFASAPFPKLALQITTPIKPSPTSARGANAGGPSTPRGIRPGCMQTTFMTVQTDLHGSPLL